MGLLKYSCVYRIQFFLKKILYCKYSIKKCFLRNAIVKENIFDSFVDDLIEEIDKIVIPTIAYELGVAKDRGLLHGDNPNTKYESFFINDDGWSQHIGIVLEKYKSLFQNIDTYIEMSFENLKKSLFRFLKDREKIEKNLIGVDNELISVVQLSSDRHNSSQQVLLFTFNNGEKLVYKPVYLEANNFFNKFIEYFNSDMIYNLKKVKTVTGLGYGWIEYLDFKECLTYEDLRVYYRRSGYLLGVLDLLNYCDGHFENLLSIGDSPVVFDLETILHNFRDVPESIGERSILFTGLIEKTPKLEDGKGYTSAFMTIGKKRVQFLEPFVVNDQTDNMHVRFISSVEKRHYNSPVFDGCIYTAKYFIDEFVDGIRKFFDVLEGCRNNILEDDNLWTSLVDLRVRQVVRHTTYYGLLIRKIQQPDKVAKGINYLREYLRGKLYGINERMNEIAEYEIDSILQYDIPYFYHFPMKNNLYNSRDEKYTNYFINSSIDSIKERIMSGFDKKYLERQVLILKHVLPASMRKVNI